MQTDSQRRAKLSFERRFKSKGGASSTFRLSGAAQIALQALADDCECSRREVLEMLILNAPRSPTRIAMKEHGLSEYEARVFIGEAQ